MIALQPKVDSIVAGIREQHAKAVALGDAAMPTWHGTAPPAYLAKRDELDQSLTAVITELERLGFASQGSGHAYNDMNDVSTQAVQATQAPGAAPFGGALGGSA